MKIVSKNNIILINIIALFLIAAFSVSSVSLVFADRKFSRFKGRVLKFGIPLYQGTPPAQYSYERLGYVKGEYKGSDMVAVIMSNALENLANNAKEMGANAAIEIEGHSGGFSSFIYEGEAVIFDELPSD